MNPKILNLWEAACKGVSEAENISQENPSEAKLDILLSFLFAWQAIQTIERKGDEAGRLIKRFIEKKHLSPFPNDAAWGIFMDCLDQKDKIPINQYIVLAKKTLNNAKNTLPQEYFLADIK